MMKNLCLFFVTIIYLLMGESAKSQTSIQGRLISVDGNIIPGTAISIEPENNTDIFGIQYEDVSANEDGSYQLHIQEPGLYRLTFRGVFHHEIRIPVMIYDQPSMKLNVLLFPKLFNDGLYFDQEDYLEWIRIVGNFNDYNYNTGEQFSLTPDGSIRAFLPVNSDTIRYYVRGLTYNQGIAVLPLADKFEYREDVGFESVLYNDLPEDSIEIRYDPDNTIPYERHLPAGVNPIEVNLNGFISLENQEDEHWIRPLSFLQSFTKTFNFVEWEMSNGVPVESQKQLQKEYSGDLFDFDLSEEINQVCRDLNNENLHPQQRAILTMNYASMLGWMARKTIFHQMRFAQEREMRIPETEPDKQIIHSVPEIVPPTHPAWIYNNGAVDYLLTETSTPQKFTDYFHDVVKHHIDARAVRFVASSIIRHNGTEYSSVEEMPVYQIILDRYGENDVARDAQMAFRNRIEE